MKRHHLLAILFLSLCSFAVKDLITSYLADIRKRYEVPVLISSYPPAKNTAPETPKAEPGEREMAETPEEPAPAVYTPNSIQDIIMPNPAEEITMIEAPAANEMGSAVLAYPIKLPAGRQGMQPALSIGYNSEGGNGWMGMGWNLQTDAIMIETRWGVPRYDHGKETETYTINGEQLSPVSHRTDTVTRSATEKEFYPRVESRFEKIIRHGDKPDNYWWEVISKDGTKKFYGGTPGTPGNHVVQNAVLTDQDQDNTIGNIAYWALTEMRDTRDNFIKYNYDKVADPGVAGGLYPGYELYPSSITYTGHGTTEGKYKVEFIRDSPGQPRRKDVTINARLGLKQVTADLLRKIRVKYNGNNIRTYELAYVTGPFYKSLLQDIKEFDAAGNLFNSHSFEYYNDVQSGNGTYQPLSSPEEWVPRNDRIRGTFINPISLFNDNASALSGNKSIGGGFGVAVTIGPNDFVLGLKTITAGVNLGFNYTRNEGLLALVDINGDGLPDKVYKKNGSLFYRANESGPDSVITFGDQKEISGINEFSKGESFSGDVGLEANVGPISAGFQYTGTEDITSTYFADANGDQLTDIVHNGRVFFNHLDAARNPHFTLSSGDTPSPIKFSAAIDPGLVIVNNEEQEKAIDDNPLHDVVKMWRAPYNGTVSISNAVALIEDTSSAARADSAKDGVRVAIQHRGNELWSADIPANDFTPKTPTGVNAISVLKGDRIYFRVQSKFNGSFDQVMWSPDITYTSHTTALTDANALPVYKFSSHDDFLITDPVSTGMIINGAIHIQGNFVKPQTSDDITVKIFRRRRIAGFNFDSTLLLQNYAWNQAVNQPLSFDLNVIKGDDFFFSVASKTNIDWKALQWNPYIYFTASHDTAITDVFDEDHNPILDFYPTVDFQAYNKSITPSLFWQVPFTDTFTIKPQPSFFPPNFETGQLVFSIKKQNQLISKQTIPVTLGFVGSITTHTLILTAGDKLYFEYHTDSIRLADRLISPGVRIDTNTVAVANLTGGLHTLDNSFIFGPMYRNWGQFAYNGNRTRADNPINESELVLDPSLTDTTLIDLSGAADTAEMQQIYRDKGGNVPKEDKFIFLLPDNEKKSWIGYDNLTYLKRDTISSSRLGKDNLEPVNPIAISTAPALGAIGIKKVTKSNNLSFSGGVGFPPLAGGLNICTGDTRSLYDFMDMNGDSYPDILSPSKIQYTRSFGGLESEPRTVFSGDVVTTTNSSRGVTLGGSFNKSGSPNSKSTSKGSKAGKSSKQSKVSAGIGGNISFNTAEDQTEVAMMDINGDGLPDRVHRGGQVELNIGYSFLPPEQWAFNGISDGVDTTYAGGVSVNIGFYSIAAGVGLSRDENKAKQILQDMNGDGLLDYVERTNPLIVHINTGNGFANPGINWGTNAVSEGVSTGESANAAFTIGFTIIPIVPVVKLCINPSVNIGQGANKTTVQFDDIDGDGYPDLLRSERDSQLTVSRSTIQRTNLLKKVNRPLGSHFTLNYQRSGNTYAMPNSVWTLASVDMYDGVPGDGTDHIRRSFDYQDGRFDRNEREFFGFGKVITRHHDTGNGDLVYRTIEEEYINDNYYEKGLLKSVVLKDSVGRKFTETVNTYSLKDIHTGAVLPNSFRQTDDGAAFPALTGTRELFYEGEPVAGKTLSREFTYDVLGNVASATDYGDADPADDITTTITYHTIPAKYIMSVPATITITGSGQIYRQQATTIDNNTGDVTEVRRYLQPGEVAITNNEYDAYGNITKVTRPQNATGQRLSYTYEFDGDVQTYRTKTTDSYGYSSSATYDVRFGQLLSVTDINGQKTLYKIDNAGRRTTITRPLEIAAGQPFTVSFEYHPEDTVPWATTKHFDPAHPANFIETATFCDGFGRIIQTKKDAALFTGPQTADQEVMIVSGEDRYDAFGRTVEIFYPVTEPKGTLNVLNTVEDGVRPAKMTFDVLNRRLTTTLPDLSVTSMKYGFGADRNGALQFKTKETDANNISTETFSNVRGLVKSTKQQYRQGTDIWTSFEYNPVDELVKVIDDRGNNIISTYDRLGRRTGVNHPDAGLTTLQYDLNGNQTQLITANLQGGTGIKYSYDHERLAKITYPQNPQNNVTLTYGASGATFFRAGRLIKQQDATGTQEFFYNPLGALIKNTRVINVPDTVPLTYTTQWTYDTWNRLTGMVYPDGEQLTYNYNLGGLLQNMSGIKSGTTYNYLPKMGYDKFEAPVYKRYGNGSEMTYAYESERRRLQKMTTRTAAGRLVMDNAYSYDREDNILGIVNNAPLPTANLMGGKSSYQYTYDDLYRLTNASGKFTGATHEHRYNVLMGYDNLSNIISKNQVHERRANNGANWVQQNQTSYNYTYNYNPGGKPHAAVHVGDKGYTYDANGNQTGWNHDVSAQNRQIEWDEENRVKTLSDNGQLFRYTYDGADQRVLKSNGNGQRVSVNGKPAGQTAGIGNYTIYVNPYMDVRSGGFTKHFYTEEGKIVSKLGESGRNTGGNGNGGGGNGNNQEAFQFYYHSDHLGSTAFITDRSGEVYQHLEYFPYGETFVEEKSNTWRTPYLYNGKELDAETGLYYFGARYFDTRTSSWPSVDLLWELPDEVNKSPYAFVVNNPLHYYDPDGRGKKRGRDDDDSDDPDDEDFMPTKKSRPGWYAASKAYVHAQAQDPGDNDNFVCQISGVSAAKTKTWKDGAGTVKTVWEIDHIVPFKYLKAEWDQLSHAKKTDDVLDWASNYKYNLRLVLHEYNSSHANEPGAGGVNPYTTVTAARKRAKEIVKMAVKEIHGD